MGLIVPAVVMNEPTVLGLNGVVFVYVGKEPMPPALVGMAPRTWSAGLLKSLFELHVEVDTVFSRGLENDQSPVTHRGFVRNDGDVRFRRVAHILRQGRDHYVENVRVDPALGQGVLLGPGGSCG